MKAARSESGWPALNRRLRWRQVFDAALPVCLAWTLKQMHSLDAVQHAALVADMALENAEDERFGEQQESGQ